MAEWVATWTANPDVRGPNPAHAGKYLRDTLVSLTYTTRRIVEEIPGGVRNVSASLEMSENI